MSRQSTDTHADWLRLVEPEGQFLTLPVVKQAFPSGLDSTKTSVRDALRKYYPKAAVPARDQWNAWTEWLLRDVLEWGPYYRTGEDVAKFTHAVPEYGVTLHADGALVKDALRVLLMRHPHGTALDERIKGDRWNTSPIDRIKELCKAHNVRLGMVTDGQRIVLVWVPGVGPGGHATWDTSLFLESRERGLLQSFTSLLRASRFFAVQEDAQIEALFEASEKFQNEVTSQLGFQVRQAVELLVNAISKANLERGGKLLTGIPPQRVYEAAATVMMRLVFLLYAEERDLLPLSEPLYADYYAASTLREQLDEQAAMEGDEPLERRGAAWNRLLATFRVIYAGLNHDRLRLPPYGGRLFDPDRFPFLEGRTEKQKWNDAASTPLFVDDLTVRAILEAIQTLPIRENGSNERRKLSFRALDVEQIGHVYEGLLDHGAERVDEVYVGLVGKTGDEAEIPVADLEKAASKGNKQLVAFLAEKTKRSESAIEKLLTNSQDVMSGKDAEMRRLLNTACDNKREIADRVAPFVYALRKDLHGLPVIFSAGSLVVKQTRARRDSGTEYTPRELAEEMVQYELEPLVYSPGPRDGAEPDKWKLRPSKELLDLKICDPAVGSGAFLVSACRYLADRLVEAWIAEDSQLESSNRDELTLDARRAVVDRCLYGVDRDSMAVEMAKLSLWLITMARERPFSFLDHSIRNGDSLLGLHSMEQLLNLHIDPTAGKRLHKRTFEDVTLAIRPLVEQAQKLRVELELLPIVSARDAETKRHLNDKADSILGLANEIADAIVAVAISRSRQSEKQRDTAFKDLAFRVLAALNAASEDARSKARQDLRDASTRELNAMCPEGSSPRGTLHWPLAFPEVFSQSDVGFDATIGNPPFVGGKKISGAFGSDFREYLVAYIADGRKGNADLVSYFFLRASQVSKSFGFLAVDTIAQGDTKEVGLDALLERGWRIVRAVKTRAWPGAANVYISQIWLSNIAPCQAPILDGDTVETVSAMLLPSSKENRKPLRLTANSGIAFQGVITLGLGFTIDPATALELISANPRNKDVLFPYLNGDDVCSRYDGTASRWVVNFFDWTIEKARQYHECFTILERAVKPERLAKASAGYAIAREKWWLYWRSRPELAEAIRGLNEVIVMPRISKVVLPVIYPVGAVFNEKTIVFATADKALFAVLSSTIHRAWARRYSSTLGMGTNYSPTDCFLTFPLPTATPALMEAGATLSEERTFTMRERKLGLTALYNRIHDEQISNEPDIDKIRNLHARLDHLVCDAYGWPDIELSYGFYATDEGLRWTIATSVIEDILQRLVDLNQQRYAEENAVVPSHDGGAKSTRRSNPVASEQQLALY